MQDKLKINFQIKASQVRLIDSNGDNLGVVSLQEALKRAQFQELDLIEINSKSIPPIVKILNVGKYKYDEKKKQSENKKNQKVQELKEITFRPNTDNNDLLHKLETSKSFLIEGHKVKFTIKFKGREISHPEVGSEKLKWILEELKDLITSPPPPISLEGKLMIVMVSPIKKN